MFFSINNQLKEKINQNAFRYNELHFNLIIEMKKSQISKIRRNIINFKPVNRFFKLR